MELADSETSGFAEADPEESSGSAYRLCTNLNFTVQTEVHRFFLTKAFIDNHKQSTRYKVGLH